jgi:hypothetical protein
MKTIEKIILAVLISLITILLSLIFDSTSINKPLLSNESEQLNILYDLKEWIELDIQEGKLDSLTGATYIENINQIISLKK